MKTFARHSLFVVAAAAAMTVHLPQAQAQCHSSGYYSARYHAPIQRAYHPQVYREEIVLQPQIQADPGLQLVDLRLVDTGAPGQAGPTIRIVFQNGSPFAASAPFDVVIAAAVGDQFSQDLPIAGQRVTEIAPGQTSVIDLRLPPQALEMQLPGAPNPAPFQNLVVMVARSRDLQGQPQLQQLAVIPRVNLRLVDLVIDPASQGVAPAGAVITLAGEGFGPQAGQALIAMGGLKLAGEIVNWSAQGVQVRLPQLALAAAAPAEITIVRGDGAAASLGLQIAPAQAAAPQQGVAVAGGAPLPPQAAPLGGQQGFDPQQQQQGFPQQGQQGQGFPQQQGQPGQQQQQAGLPPQGQQGGFPQQGQGFPQQQGLPGQPQQQAGLPPQGFDPQQQQQQGGFPAGQGGVPAPGLGLIGGSGPVR